MLLFLYAAILNWSELVNPAFQIDQLRHSSLLLHWLFETVGLLKIPVLISVLAIVSVYLAGLLVGRLFNRFKFANQSSWLPAYVFVLLGSSFPSLVNMIPVIVSVCFLVLLLHKVFAFSEKEELSVRLFDAGLMAALASLVYFPAVVCLLLMLIGLFTQRTVAWREWSVGMLGFATPYWLLFSGLYFFGELNWFWEGQMLKHLQEFALVSLPSTACSIALIIPIILSLPATWKLQGIFLQTPIHVRKLFLILGWLVMLSLLSFPLQSRLFIEHFLIIAVPLSVLFSFVVSELKKPVIAETAHALFVLYIIILPFIS